MYYWSRLMKRQIFLNSTIYAIIRISIREVNALKVMGEGM